jgi:hypothetical protein
MQGQVILSQDCLVGVLSSSIVSTVCINSVVAMDNFVDRVTEQFTSLLSQSCVDDSGLRVLDVN